MWVPVRPEGLGGVDASRHFAELHRLVSRQTHFRCWLGSWLSKGVSRASAETNAGRHTLAYRFAGRREATAQLFGGTFFLLALASWQVLQAGGALRHFYHQGVPPCQVDKFHLVSDPLSTTVKRTKTMGTGKKVANRPECHSSISRVLEPVDLRVAWHFVHVHHWTSATT